MVLDQFESISIPQGCGDGVETELERSASAAYLRPMESVTDLFMLIATALAAVAAIGSWLTVSAVRPKPWLDVELTRPESGKLHVRVASRGNGEVIHPRVQPKRGETWRGNKEYGLRAGGAGIDRKILPPGTEDGAEFEVRDGDDFFVVWRQANDPPEGLRWMWLGPVPPAGATSYKFGDGCYFDARNPTLPMFGPRRRRFGREVLAHGGPNVSR